MVDKTQFIMKHKSCIVKSSIASAVRTCRFTCLQVVELVYKLLNRIQRNTKLGL